LKDENTNKIAFYRKENNAFQNKFQREENEDKNVLKKMKCFSWMLGDRKKKLNIHKKREIMFMNGSGILKTAHVK
jgi:hypothetical protein